LLHTNLIHSISRKNWTILHKIGQVIQIVVHQFVHKTSSKKKNLSEKKWSPFIPRYAGIRRISTKEKKMIPYKPYIHRKHVESILGTCKNMTKKVFNLNNTIPHSVHLVDPYSHGKYAIHNKSNFWMIDQGGVAFKHLVLP
jgi:hypothetical protein